MHNILKDVRIEKLLEIVNKIFEVCGSVLQQNLCTQKKYDTCSGTPLQIVQHIIHCITANNHHLYTKKSFVNVDVSKEELAATLFDSGTLMTSPDTHFCEL